MSGVHRSTDQCDCPSARKTRRIEDTSDSRNGKRKKDLTRELRKTKEDLFVARKVLAESRSKLVTFKSILSLELGFSVEDPFNSVGDSWRDRIHEKAYLKSELVKLVDYLRKCDAYYRTDPAYHPTRLSTSTEDGALADLTACDSEKALRDVFRLKKDYEDELYCNKVVEKEIETAKKRISELQEQYLEDKSLVDCTTTHCFKMRETFGDHHFRSRRTVSDANQGEATVDPEALKFKKLWEESEIDKQNVKKSLEALAKKLDLANQKIVRVENVCSGNVVTFRNLVEKFKNDVLLLKVVPKRKEEFGKYSVIEFRLQKNQLAAAKDENKYLRNFLSKVVLSSKDDWKKLQESLKSSADKYRIVLENIRNDLSAKEPDKHHPEK